MLSQLALAMLAREGQPDLKFEHAICVSFRLRELLVDAGVPVQHAHIIHGGTDIQRFPNVREREDRLGI